MKTIHACSTGRLREQTVVEEDGCENGEDKEEESSSIVFPCLRVHKFDKPFRLEAG